MTDTVVETHCSTLVFTGECVYKRKKPVDLGFLDFRDPEVRRSTCEAEVALNRRFAPDTYLGVATLTGPGTPWGEPLVVMRRLPADRRLSDVITTGEDVGPALRALAEQLAGVHRTSPAPRDLLELGRPEHLAALWSATLDVLDRHPDLTDGAARERVRLLASRYLLGRRDLFLARMEQGRVVDGHGDLLAEDVFLLEQGPRALDCLEFDPRLRVGDGLLDAAFLAMDLERLGRADLARAFLEDYRAAAADDAPDSFEHHVIAYRAAVRAKVACLRHDQTGAPGDAWRARQHLDLAVRHLEAGRVRLVLVGGAPGSGKSTLARAIAPALSAQRLSSDELRVALLGPAPPTPDSPGTGRHDSAATQHVYDVLLARAADLLRQGRSVVLDATFSAAGHRASARTLARSTSSDLDELCCEVDPVTADARITHRCAGSSDATPAVRSWVQGRTDSWPEALRIPTTGPAEVSVRQALAALDACAPA